MTIPPNSLHQQEQLLPHFIRQVGECNDTPSLIMLIAADADYLQLCRFIIDPAAESSATFVETIISACRYNGMNPQGLKETLTPAARALGLLQSANASPDYYHLLGVRSQANTQEIKTAFRRKAVKIHPDANANLTGSSRQFVELNEAYRTLSDPAMRHLYDAKRNHLKRWREHPGQTLPADSRSAIFFWCFYGLFFTFIILLLFLDWIVL